MSTTTTTETAVTVPSQRVTPETGTPDYVPPKFDYSGQYGIKGSSRQSAVDITAAINGAFQATGEMIERLGSMLATAYQRKVHVKLGYETWAEYVKAEIKTDGFKPETDVRRYLVKILRNAGMTYAEVAQTTSASERTVKSDAEQAGQTNKRAKSSATSSKSSKPATEGSPVGDWHTIVSGMNSDELNELLQFASERLRKLNAMK